MREIKDVIPMKFRDTPNIGHYPRFGKLKNFEVTEKVDGANFRFMRNNNDELIFGSRNRSPIDTNSVGGINLDTSFLLYTTHVKKLIGDIKKVQKKFIYFAEAMMPHNVPYKHTKTLVLGFAVYDLNKRVYVKNWKDMFDEINIPTVRVFDMDMYTDNSEDWRSVCLSIESQSGTRRKVGKKLIFNDDYVLLSCVDNHTWIEGVVFSDYENQVFYKYKTERFREKAGKAFGKAKSPDTFSKFFNKYVTRSRATNILENMSLGNLKYNTNNPLPDIARLITYDIFKEAVVRDLYKTFGNELMQQILKAIREDEDLMKQSMKLKKRSDK